MPGVNTGAWLNTALYAPNTTTDNSTANESPISQNSTGGGHQLGDSIDELGQGSDISADWTAPISPAQMDAWFYNTFQQAHLRRLDLP
jgi:hypothetical protein